MNRENIEIIYNSRFLTYLNLEHSNMLFGFKQYLVE